MIFVVWLGIWGFGVYFNGGRFWFNFCKERYFFALDSLFLSCFVIFFFNYYFSMLCAESLLLLLSFFFFLFSFPGGF